MQPVSMQQVTEMESIFFQLPNIELLPLYPVKSFYSSSYVNKKMLGVTTNESKI